MQSETIAQAVVQFLTGFGSLEMISGYADSGEDQYGLIKGADRTVKDCIGGAYEITENYQFYAKQISDSDGTNKKCDEWLEELTYWADDYSFQYEYPALSGGRHIENMELTGIPYTVDAENNEMIYKLVLTVTYVREREDY